MARAFYVSPPNEVGVASRLLNKVNPHPGGFEKRWNTSVHTLTTEPSEAHLTSVIMLIARAAILICNQ